MSKRGSILLASLLLLVLSGCTSTFGQGDRPETTLASPPTTSPNGTAIDASPSVDVERIGVRVCLDSISSASRAAEHRLNVGPVTFLAMDLESLASLPGLPEQGRLKYVLVLSANAVGPVVLELDQSVWDSAGLMYDPTTFAAEHLAETHTKVAFQPCPGQLSQHAGGFMVTAPVCVAIRVTDQGVSGGETHSAAIPFMVPHDTCVSSEARDD